MDFRSSSHLVSLALGSALLLSAAPDALAQWSIPAELQEEASVLDDAQLRFLTSGEALDYLPERQLVHEIATRDADALRALVDDLRALAARMGYDPTRDMGAAPLNLTSKRFGAPVPTPAPLRELEREPGPFSVSRYMFPKSGVPTFGGADVAIWPEDLVAGDVDVAIVGVPSNSSSGRRDSIDGPDEMRASTRLRHRTCSRCSGRSRCSPWWTTATSRSIA